MGTSNASLISAGNQGGQGITAGTPSGEGVAGLTTANTGKSGIPEATQIDPQTAINYFNEAATQYSTSALTGLGAYDQAVQTASQQITTSTQQANTTLTPLSNAGTAAVNQYMAMLGVSVPTTNTSLEQNMEQLGQSYLSATDTYSSALAALGPAPTAESVLAASPTLQAQYAAVNASGANGIPAGQVTPAEFIANTGNNTNGGVNALQQAQAAYQTQLAGITGTYSSATAPIESQVAAEDPGDTQAIQAFMTANPNATSAQMNSFIQTLPGVTGSGSAGAGSTGTVSPANAIATADPWLAPLQAQEQANLINTSQFQTGMNNDSALLNGLLGTTGSSTTAYTNPTLAQSASQQVSSAYPLQGQQGGGTATTGTSAGGLSNSGTTMGGGTTNVGQSPTSNATGSSSSTGWNTYAPAGDTSAMGSQAINSALNQSGGEVNGMYAAPQPPANQTQAGINAWYANNAALLSYGTGVTAAQYTAGVNGTATPSYTGGFTTDPTSGATTPNNPTQADQGVYYNNTSSNSNAAEQLYYNTLLAQGVSPTNAAAQTTNNFPNSGYTLQTPPQSLYPTTSMATPPSVSAQYGQPVTTQPWTAASTPTSSSTTGSTDTYTSSSPTSSTGSSIASVPTSSTGSSTGSSTDSTSANNSILQTLQNTPGYQFSLQQGNNAVLASAAANGMLGSGNTLAAADQYSQGLAQQTYQNSVTNAQNAYDAQESGYLTGSATNATSLANIGNQSQTAYQSYMNNLMGISTLGSQATGQIATNQINSGSAQASLTQSAGQAAINAYTGIGTAQANAQTNAGNTQNSDNIANMNAQNQMTLAALNASTSGSNAALGQTGNLLNAANNSQVAAGYNAATNSIGAGYTGNNGGYGISSGTVI
ncbi:hypothetical protein UFOVP1_47 [uncultured Caudovirales phage]|uniref:Uncharacterized protein n=1 Tax=uncultured Caudovirales phage TaxID=2100421 RepID=A0A6J5KHD1_9CAUD|nr:hypothetical protein UFOVP1_47 [uncultured Caudovirales phage]